MKIEKTRNTKNPMDSPTDIYTFDDGRILHFYVATEKPGPGSIQGGTGVYIDSNAISWNVVNAMEVLHALLSGKSIPAKCFALYPNVLTT